MWVFDERRRVRDDVASRLVALPSVARVEAVGDPASLLARLATRQPDVLLVGTQRATDSGLAVATQVLRLHPSVPVLVLGAPTTPRASVPPSPPVPAATCAGTPRRSRWASGLPRRPARRARPARRTPVRCRRRRLLGPGLERLDRLASAAPTTVRAAVRVDVPAVTLSVREMQVLTGMSQGKSNAQIGRELYLSEDTIKTHARRLFRKLGAKDRAEAVASGFRRGMMS